MITLLPRGPSRVIAFVPDPSLALRSTDRLAELFAPVFRRNRALVPLALRQHPEGQDIVDLHDAEKINTTIAALTDDLDIGEAEAEKQLPREALKSRGFHRPDDVEEFVLPCIVSKLVQFLAGWSIFEIFRVAVLDA